MRKQGLIPAELYGRGISNEHIAVPVKEFVKVLKSAGENTVINVMIDGKPRPALIYEVDKDPLTGAFLNVDFYQVRMDEQIQTEVPVVFIGDAPAVKEFGGILIKAMQEIKVEALPMNLPRQIDVSLAGLDALNKSIYVRDLKQIEGVKFLVGPDTVIVTVKEPTVEEEKVEAPAAAAPGETAAATETPTNLKEKEASGTHGSNQPKAGQPRAEKAAK